MHSNVNTRPMTPGEANLKPNGVPAKPVAPEHLPNSPEQAHPEAGAAPQSFDFCRFLEDPTQPEFESLRRILLSHIERKAQSIDRDNSFIAEDLEMKQAIAEILGESEIPDRPSR